MSLKRRCIQMLDRDFGRPLLSFMITVYARHKLKDDVAVGYDKGWWHRLGKYYVPDGQRFNYYAWDVMSWKGQISNLFENAQEFWFFHYRPKTGDVIVDIGAGRGEDALAFSKAVGQKGKVFSIEAHPESFDYLRRFCELNQLSNVVPIHAAITDRSGVAHIGGDDNWVADSINGEGIGHAVRAMTLADFCDEYDVSRIDYLKMNIEGAEREALLGSIDILPKLNDVCICAHDFRADLGHGEQFRTREFVIEFLSKSGYCVSCRTSDPRDFVRDHIFGRRGAGCL